MGAEGSLSSSFNMTVGMMNTQQTCTHSRGMEEGRGRIGKKTAELRGEEGGLGGEYGHNIDMKLLKNFLKSNKNTRVKGGP